MRLLILFLLFSINCLSQDTVKYQNFFIVYDGVKILEKRFIDKNSVKIVYQYNSSGILVRRWWYDKNNNLISVSLED